VNRFDTVWEPLLLSICLIALLVATLR